MDTRRWREHEYEPIGAPLVNPRTMTPVTPSAPVVRIIDTDVAPVADSDDSIDLGARFGPVLEGNELVLPLDGRIEDSAMETRESAGDPGGPDTSEEIETPRRPRDRLEERFFNAAAPSADSRTDREGATSQVDTSRTEERASQQRGARGLPQRLRSQAGKLRSRIKSIQRPNFSLSIDRLRSKRAKSPGVSRGSSEPAKRGTPGRKSPPSERGRKSESSRASGGTEKPSRIDRIRSSLSIDRPRLSLPDRSKFRLPARPRFNMKRPNVRFPALKRLSRGSSPETRRSREGGVVRSDGSTSGDAPAPRGDSFDFSTYPRIFERRSREKPEYATSSPKDSRAESLESSSLPRLVKRGSVPLGPRWSLRFTDIKFADDEDEPDRSLAERSEPWRRPSLEQPRLSLRPEESFEEPASLPWHREDRRPNPDDDEFRSPADPAEGGRGRGEVDSLEENEDEEEEEEERELEEERLEREAYRAAFEALDPRCEKRAKLRDESAELGTTTLDDEEIVSSGLDEDARSDREQQQSSGSSYDRRRRGIVEEVTDESEVFPAGGETRQAARLPIHRSRERRPAPEEDPAREILAATAEPPRPPERPERKRSARERREASVESGEIVAPVRSKREARRRSLENYEYEEEREEDEEEEEEEEEEDDDDDESFSESRHRIVYHAAVLEARVGLDEPLDDIVVLKPQRRKSRSSLTGRSLGRSESSVAAPEEANLAAAAAAAAPSAPPRRRKRPRTFEDSRLNDPIACNGHHSPAKVPLEGEAEVEGDVAGTTTTTTTPRKPRRASAARRILVASDLERYDEIDAPPVPPPKRPSRSRGASLAPDDDRTSRGAESIPEAGYLQEEIPEDTEDSTRLDYPGYATIEKREKPPRPPPPRNRRDEKFATCPRVGKPPSSRGHGSPGRPPPRPRTPAGRPPEDETTAPEESIDSDRDEARPLRSGLAVSDIQGRPLPAPPRPPRSRRERNPEASLDGERLGEPGEGRAPEVAPEVAAGALPGPTGEAFASTQTDPLPDDLVIEEEATRAKLVVAPSRSGSRILVSTERVPSPTIPDFALPRSYSQGAEARARVPDSSRTSGYPGSEEFTGLPPERSRSQGGGLERPRRRSPPGPTRGSTAPVVPPLPVPDYRDEECGIEGVVPRKIAPPSRRDYRREEEEEEDDGDDGGDDDDDDEESRLSRAAFEERLGERIAQRLRLEEELDRARNPRAAILANEPFRIASLEVSDLRVDRLNVNDLEARKLTASEIEAVVVSASEITSKTEPPGRPVDLEPDLLRELAAIRSQLELVNAAQETPGTRDRARQQPEKKPTRVLDAPGLRESLRLEEGGLSGTTAETGESSPDGGPTAPRIRSRSSSPSRTGGPTGPRRTASPVKSLPPVISVTPDTPEPVRGLPDRPNDSSRIPQRAVLSYVPEDETFGSSPAASPPIRPSVLSADDTRFVTFPVSRIPPEFFGLAASPPSLASEEPGLLELGRRLARALGIASRRAVGRVVARVVDGIGNGDTDAKTREAELAICALLLVIAGLLIVCFGGPRTVTHHHHWDYFNPPRL